MLILIIFLAIIFAGGGGYFGYSRWGSRGGIFTGLVLALLILLLCHLLGVL
jgi:hypothetical protein